MKWKVHTCEYPLYNLMLFHYSTTTGFDIISVDFLNRYIEVYPSKKSDIQAQYGRGRGDATVSASRIQKSRALGFFGSIIFA